MEEGGGGHGGNDDGVLARQARHGSRKSNRIDGGRGVEGRGACLGKGLGLAGCCCGLLRCVAPRPMRTQVLFFFSLASLELLPSCPAFSKRPGLGWPELPSMAAARKHVPARASLVGF